MSSTAISRRLFVARPGAGVLFDASIAAVALAGTLALIVHFPGSGADTELDWLAIVLAVCASAPLVLWRQSPIGFSA